MIIHTEHLNAIAFQTLISHFAYVAACY